MIGRALRALIRRMEVRGLGDPPYWMLPDREAWAIKQSPQNAQWQRFTAVLRWLKRFGVLKGEEAGYYHDLRWRWEPNPSPQLAFGKSPMEDILRLEREVRRAARVRCRCGHENQLHGVRVGFCLVPGCDCQSFVRAEGAA